MFHDEPNKLQNAAVLPPTPARERQPGECTGVVPPIAAPGRALDRALDDVSLILARHSAADELRALNRAHKAVAGCTTLDEAKRVLVALLGDARITFEQAKAATTKTTEAGHG